MEQDEMQTYICSYPYQGGNWSFLLYATSLEDARKRVAALQHTEVHGTLSVLSGRVAQALKESKAAEAAKPYPVWL